MDDPYRELPSYIYQFSAPKKKHIISPEWMYTCHSVVGWYLWNKWRGILEMEMALASKVPR